VFAALALGLSNFAASIGVGLSGVEAKRGCEMGAALSIDNLIVGVALGTQRVSLILTAVIITSVSVALSLVGLEIRKRLGVSVEKWSPEIGGAVLALVGVAIVLGAA
jgi:putative Mn2+ efflux pump MntP